MLNTIGGFLVLGAALSFAAGIGLLQRESWGRILALVMAFLRGWEDPSVFIKSANARRLGGGDVDLRSGLRTAGALTFKVTNKLDADHGFAIDAMKVKQVMKPGEEVTISVPMGDLDQALAVYKFYCHLHPGHIGGTLVVVK